MLVKELRQGLRTRSFIGVFLALQIILGVTTIAAILAVNYVTHKEMLIAIFTPIFLPIVALSFLGTLLYPALIINLFRMKGPVRVSNYFASISEVRQSISSTE